MNAIAPFDIEEAIARSMKAMRLRELSRGGIDEAVLQVLQASAEPLGTSRIANVIAHSRDAVRRSLERLEEAGQVIRSREAGWNRKRFVFTAPVSVPGVGIAMTPDEAAVFAVFADGRERTIDDVARKVGKLANPLSLILRRLIASGAIRSKERKSVMVYRKAPTQGGAA